MTLPVYLDPLLSIAWVDGAQMSWRETGGGEALPLFMMHGVGTNARLWAGQFAAFGGERRVIAWNAPGYVGSDPVASEWPVADDYAQRAVALLNHLGVDRCIVVSQSLGAVMATALALRAPERVAALALTSPAAGHAVPVGGQLPETMDSRLKDVAALTTEEVATRRAPRLLGPHAGPEARAIIHKAMSEIVPGGYAQAVRMFASADLPAVVGGLSIPTLVMWGDADVVTPPDECRRVADAAPAGSMCHEIPGVGHAMAAEAPAAFNAALRELIAQADNA